MKHWKMGFSCRISKYFLLVLMLFFIDSCSTLKTSDDDSSGALRDQFDEVETVHLPDIPIELGEIDVQSISDEELRSIALAEKTFPLVYNQYVQQWINYFTGRGRPHMQRYMERSTRYIGLMSTILKEEGLPEDLIYLSMIESGFNTSATSRVGAQGPWQFMPFTGKRFGLKVDYWVDERNDYIKSTRAAAQYLKELHHIFGSWYLAAAAYNAGEGRVLGAIRTNRTRNFWELQRNPKAFRPETRNYVPKLIAAALISRNPQNYGFNKLNYESPLAWEEAEVPGRIGLRSVAKVSGSSFEDLRILNPELRMQITPDSKTYMLKVPPSARATLAANIDKLEQGNVSSFVQYRVRSGDNLGSIARRHRSNVQAIMELNRIRNPRHLRIGQNLQIPVHVPGETAQQRRVRLAAERVEQNNPVEAARSGRNTPTSTPARTASAGGTSGATDTYVVRSGDSLWSISQRFGMTVNELRSLNGIRGNNIRAGSRLRVRPSQASGGSSSKTMNLQSYVVRRGDTLGGIAQRHNMSLTKILTLNGLRGNHIQAGSTLRVKARLPEFYQVRRGDTLTHIAQRYGLSVQELKRRNRIAQGSNLQAGQRIRLR